MRGRFWAGAWCAALWACAGKRVEFVGRRVFRSFQWGRRASNGDRNAFLCRDILRRGVYRRRFLAFCCRLAQMPQLERLDSFNYSLPALCSRTLPVGIRRICPADLCFPIGNCAVFTRHEMEQLLVERAWLAPFIGIGQRLRTRWQKRRQNLNYRRADFAGAQQHRAALDARVAGRLLHRGARGFGVLSGRNPRQNRRPSAR